MIATIIAAVTAVAALMGAVFLWGSAKAVKSPADLRRAAACMLIVCALQTFLFVSSVGDL